MASEPGPETGERGTPLATRRTVLAAAVSTTAAATVGMLGPSLPAYAADPAPDDDPSDFNAVSAVLTGINVQKLAPKVDPVSVGLDYFRFLKNKEPQLLARLLDLYRANSTLPPRELGARLLDPSTGDLVYFGRSVILMWYLGAWYEPQLLAQLATHPDNVQIDFHVISSKAYSQGWVWRVAQTHPMGYSEWSFGYWQKQPPCLELFIETKTT